MNRLTVMKVAQILAQIQSSGLGGTAVICLRQSLLVAAYEVEALVRLKVLGQAFRALGRTVDRIFGRRQVSGGGGKRFGELLVKLLLLSRWWRIRRVDVERRVPVEILDELERRRLLLLLLRGVARQSRRCPLDGGGRARSRWQRFSRCGRLKLLRLGTQIVQALVLIFVVLDSFELDGFYLRRKKYLKNS